MIDRVPPEFYYNGGKQAELGSKQANIGMGKQGAPATASARAASRTLRQHCCNRQPHVPPSIVSVETPKPVTRR